MELSCVLRFTHARCTSVVAGTVTFLSDSQRACAALLFVGRRACLGSFARRSRNDALWVNRTWNVTLKLNADLCERAVVFRAHFAIWAWQRLVDAASHRQFVCRCHCTRFFKRERSA
jgi:hypothetical protein